MGAAPPEEVSTHLMGCKRKLANYNSDDNDNTGQLETDTSSKKLKPTTVLEDGQTSSKKISKAKGKQVDKNPNGSVKIDEKRLRRFRKSPPQAYLVIKERALSQRLIVQDRTRCGTNELPEEKVMIAGSTGNLYTVHVGLVPTCTCPYNAKKGHQCKHIIYVSIVAHFAKS